MNWRSMQKALGSFLLLCTLVSIAHATEHVTENVREEGSISSSSGEDFVITSQIDWSKYQFSFLLVSYCLHRNGLIGSDKQQEAAVIANLTLTCADITLHTFSVYCSSDGCSVLLHNQTENLFHRESVCWDSDSSFRIENTDGGRIHYSIIIQRMEGAHSRLR